jgi:hypothetical protein
MNQTLTRAALDKKFVYTFTFLKCLSLSIGKIMKILLLYVLPQIIVNIIYSPPFGFLLFELNSDHVLISKIIH